MADDVLKIINNHALNLLARREHTQLELKNKLVAKGFPVAEVHQVIAGLTAKNLQSDERFTEAYTNMRKSRGFGPLHIQAELHVRGVADEIIQRYVFAADIDWLTIAQAVRRKKFGEEIPTNFVEQAKQKRYLQYKGFDFDLLKAVFSRDN